VVIVAYPIQFLKLHTYVYIVIYGRILDNILQLFVVLPMIIQYNEERKLTKKHNMNTGKYIKVLSRLNMDFDYNRSF
jgi:hypothetical protein